MYSSAAQHTPIAAAALLCLLCTNSLHSTIYYPVTSTPAMSSTLSVPQSCWVQGAAWLYVGHLCTGLCCGIITLLRCGSRFGPDGCCFHYCIITGTDDEPVRHEHAPASDPQCLACAHHQSGKEQGLSIAAKHVPAQADRCHLCLLTNAVN